MECGAPEQWPWRSRDRADGATGRRLVRLLATARSAGVRAAGEQSRLSLDEAALAQVEPGRTTRDEVQQLLGSPSSITTFDGAVWYYVSQRTERMSFYQEEVVNQDVVSITFDDLGTVKRIDRHGLEEAREVSLVDRETPTSGSELNAFEQFIGNIGRFNPPADIRR